MIHDLIRQLHRYNNDTHNPLQLNMHDEGETHSYHSNTTRSYCFVVKQSESSIEREGQVVTALWCETVAIQPRKGGAC